MSNQQRYLSNQQRRCFANSARDQAGLLSLALNLRNQAHSRVSYAASSQRAGRILIRQVFIVASLAHYFDGKAPAVDEDANAAPVAGCRREAADLAASSD